MTDTLAQAWTDAITRICEMQKRVIPESNQALPYPVFDQLVLPYWENSPGPTPEPDDPHDITRWVMVVSMRLVVGYITEGYQGDVAGKAWGYIPTVVRYFRRYNRLKDLPGQEGIRYLAPAGVTITPPSGFTVAAVGPQKLMLEFELNVPFHISDGV